MCAFVLYDTQLIMEKRRNGDKDFIAHSVDLFIDFIGIFRRLLIILAQKVLLTMRILLVVLSKIINIRKMKYSLMLKIFFFFFFCKVITIPTCRVVIQL